ncbi:MAG: hypothetical protein GY789_26405 [Hyphomicrobiales bacterium]|nr:hypothetical protein [Hyphomicrobiales bacterium]
MSAFKTTVFGLLATVSVAAIFVGYSATKTRSEIDTFEQSVQTAASATHISMPDADDMANLPEPVRNYFGFVFPGGIKAAIKWVEIEEGGQFRRPLTEEFAPTTARQVIASAKPDLVFSANTPLWGPIWAIAYDAYIDGNMEMEARLLSTISVMHEYGTPVLNQISLRRWLLESPCNPAALLPGGIVEWQAIDDHRARAIARAHGLEASLVATFDEKGALISFEAEEDGDMTTPYHGSGEHVSRSDYQVVDGVRIPMAFEISRMAKGKLYPFWSGRITGISFRL